jgi:hypothetical protein
MRTQGYSLPQENFTPSGERSSSSGDAEPGIGALPRRLTSPEAESILGPVPILLLSP